MLSEGDISTQVKALVSTQQQKSFEAFVVVPSQAEKNRR